MRIQQSWQIRKPAVTSGNGLVATQHYIASEVGAGVLREGGNAIDAAVAAGLTLGTIEPWMSGIGGGGYMTIYLAESREVRVVEFGMRAPLDAVPGDYPLAGQGTNAGDAFNWPAVTGDSNIHGALSAAVPGYVRGISLALDTWGTWSWDRVIEPACREAEAGLPIDWFSAQKINQFARGLRMYEETARTYLADGLPPAANIEGTVDRLPLGNLAQTYRSLQRNGPGSFYNGDLADIISGDLARAGSRITVADLIQYEAGIADPLVTSYRGGRLNVSGNLTAGPSIIHALGELEKTTLSSQPDSHAFNAYAQSLLSAYEHRLANLGEGQNGNTTHLCAADAAGNVVSLTQTIMSAFGSRIMLPRTGILMNNGMMWFDPRPGGPNSVQGGRRPLCNMCPVILEGEDGSITAIGACGGRKIFPAVFQLTSFLSDFNMSVDEAVHQARIDVSGTDEITVMDHMDQAVTDHLSENYANTSIRPNGVNPNQFALPQVIRRNADGSCEGGCFIPSPHAMVSAAD